MKNRNKKKTKSENVCEKGFIRIKTLILVCAVFAVLLICVF